MRVRSLRWLGQLSDFLTSAGVKRQSLEKTGLWILFVTLYCSVERRHADLLGRTLIFAHDSRSQRGGAARQIKREGLRGEGNSPAAVAVVRLAVYA